MDKIQIIITRGCDSEGNGGTVVDSAAAILGDVAGNGPMVEAIAAAFQDAYGLHQIEVDGEMVPVSSYRNVAYRVRQFMTEITTAYLRKQAVAQVTEHVSEQVEQTLGSVVIKDQV